MNEKIKILHLATQKLSDNITVNVQWQAKENAPFYANLQLTLNNNREKWLVEIKSVVTKAHLPALFALNEKHPGLLLIAKTISPQIRQELKKRGIAYLDAAGNAFLNKNHFIYIDGRKPDSKEAQPGRVFTNSGLKAIFLFLLNETLLNDSYRQIAKQAHIALGNMPRIFEGLKKKGFLLKLDESVYKLKNRKILLERWITEYEEKLKPTLFMGRYRFLNHDISDWQNIHFIENEGFWSGEPGADKLTGYLKPEMLTIYTDKTKMDLMRKFQLIPDDNGFIWLYEKFWQAHDTQVETVPPLLVYADLVSSGDARNIETAQIIKEQYLENIAG